MALRPTGPGEPRVPAPRTRPAQTPARAAPSAPPAPPERARPDRGFKIKTATAPHEIERQIQRLMNLIANDNIDPEAPPGSYLNMLV